MKTTEMDKLMDKFDHLTLDDQEYMLDVLKKQVIEAKRDTIAKKAKKAISNYRKGITKNGSFKDLCKDLESD